MQIVKNTTILYEPFVFHFVGSFLSPNKMMLTFVLSCTY